MLVLGKATLVIGCTGELIVDLDVDEDRCADTDDQEQCFQSISGESTGKAAQWIPVWGLHLRFSHHATGREPGVVVGK